MLSFDCVVVGSGPAGMTSAIYLKRANLNVTLIEKSAPGGKLNNVLNIENYPGFTSIEGSQLSLNMYKQVKEMGIDYRYGNVLDIEDHGEYKIIVTDVEKIKCTSVIIAGGRIPRKLGLQNEEELIGRGIGFCALCDGSFYKNKKVAVVGGGNSALEDAIYLANICKEVIIVHRGNKFTAEEVTQDQIKNYDNISVKFNSVISTITPEDGKLKSITIQNNDSQEIINVDAMFINIGYIPDVSYLKNLNIRLDNDYIIVDNQMRTNIKNIYACGDIIKKEVYQITTATGDATIAAISAKRDIN